MHRRLVWVLDWAAHGRALQLRVAVRRTGTGTRARRGHAGAESAGSYQMRVSCRRTSSWSRHRAQSSLARRGVRRRVAELGVSARTFGPLGYCLKIGSEGLLGGRPWEGNTCLLRGRRKTERLHGGHMLLYPAGIQICICKRFAHCCAEVRECTRAEGMRAQEQRAYKCNMR